MSHRRNALLAALAAGVATLLTTALMVSTPASAAATPTATFSKDSSWETGYTARYTVTASDTAALNGWRVEFDLASGTTVGAYWDSLLTTSGTHYSFVNREYNGSVAARGSVSFGFNVNGTANPTNCRLNGQPCGGGTTPPTTTTTTRTTTTTTGPPPPPPPPGNAGAAPYIDITMPSPSLMSVANATGHKVFHLAFVLGDSTGCNPSWGGILPLNDSRIINDIRALKAAGGDVIVASGGAVGPYLEHVCGTQASLLAAYKRVLDAVGSNRLDIDVEAAIPQDMVNTTLAQLQRERGTAISYTMRVQGDTFGMDPYSVQVLQSAAARGVNVKVNPMTMEFGSSMDWGDAVISAAQASLGQMRQIWPSKSDAELKRMLGVTPMIGRNFNGKIFTQAHARKLVTWATSNHIGLLAFWSAGRDNGSCPGGGVSATCSSISQSTFEFTNIFKGFRG